MEQIINYELFLPFTEGDETMAKWLVNRLVNKYDCNAYNSMLSPYGVITVNNYLRKVITHKIAVREAGLELLNNYEVSKFLSDNDMFTENIIKFKDRLIVHDLSKFSPAEAIGYAFYSFDGTAVNSKQAKDDFEHAWHHHKMNNDHHPEYWLNPNREGKLEVLPMTNLAIVEMIADWIGAGKTYGNTLENWLPKNFDKFLFHVVTKTKVVNLLTELGYM